QTGGLKHFSNYPRVDYSAHSQNWSILQDKRGIIYIGNHTSLIEFDGVSWRKINVPNRNVNSMAIDDTGIIYVGGNNEIGFLAPDPKGNLKYVSLLGYLENNHRNFSNVWRTHCTKEGIYFRTSRFLFRWNPVSKTMNKWQTQLENKFRFSFAWQGKLFIQKAGTPLMQMINNRLTAIPGGNVFNSNQVYVIAPYESQRWLIGTRSNGFYIYDGIKARHLSPAAAGHDLKGKNIYYGIPLINGDFAIATQRGGLFIMTIIPPRENEEPTIRIKKTLDETSGLSDNRVNYVFQDSGGNLWLALNNGLAKIEHRSGISIYDDRLNLPGLVQTLSRHGPQKDLYAGTDRGLYRLGPGGRFHPVPGITSQCWSLLSIDETLLVAAFDGVARVGPGIDPKHRIIPYPSYLLHRSRTNPNRIWLGTRQGLVSLFFDAHDKSPRSLTVEHIFANPAREISKIVEDQEGNLWLGTLAAGVLRVTFSSAGTIKEPAVTGYNESHGLTRGTVRVFKAAGHIMFATDNGIFRFDEKDNLFSPDTTLGDKYAGRPNGKGVFFIVEDKKKNIWFHSESRNIQAILQPDNTYKLYQTPFLRIADAQVSAIYPDPDGNTIWFAGNNGLMRYDTRVKKNYRFDFPTLIRNVKVNGNPIFNGYKTKLFAPVIPYKDRNLRFEFAAPFFQAETSTRYRFFLEGYEDQWSPFTPETKKDYTNLDAGKYTFRVQAQNIYLDVSREARFQFKILPPWTQTWWAFIIYFIAALLVMFLVVQWRSGKLEREKQKLAKIIQQRTKEIQEKNLLLERKTDQLEEQSGKLKELDKAKSRFFANISHEFRTPLTLIMGPLDRMITGTGDEEQEKTFNMMLRNSQRLLRLINQLLQLSKFDSGSMKLQASQQDIVSFLKGIAASFDSVTNTNGPRLTFHSKEEHIPLHFDAEKLEEVILNLLSNAIKFTPPNGEITVTAAIDPAKDPQFPAGSLDIGVSDTGAGIPQDQLEFIFDRFYQSDSTWEHHRKGSGIGLSIVKELVELHHGTIQVQRREGTGTRFTLRLPLGTQHLKPREIAHPTERPRQPAGPREIPDHYINMMEEEPPQPPGPTDTAQEETQLELEAGAGAEPGAEPGANKKDIILVVEDNAEVRDFIKGSLEPLYIIKEAADGQEGIKKALEIIPDLIVSDIMMPGTDGYELCRQLKTNVRTSHIPIVLLTAKASDDSVIAGLETGADDYIAKPFNTKILCARIKNLIDLRRHIQQTLKRDMALQPAKIAVSSVDQTFLKELQEVIEKNLSDTLFNVEKLAGKLYMSRASLYRKVLALTGEPPREFIRSYRLKRGAQLLKANFGNVNQVAFEVGFSSSPYFTKCFKEKFHQLPRTYQASEGRD
ncbi:MAG: response regulator, partial [bacterium]|nr:response regulator [bacterium]